MILDSPIISGSSTVTGNLTVLGTLNASVSGSVTSASYATNAETLDGLDSTSFTTTSSFTAYTASTNASILSNIQNIAILYVSSSVLDSRVTKTEATASSLTTASSSFSTRVSASEASISNLTTASGSFSTRTTNLETASGSFSTRVSSNESNISSLQTASGSFSTRTTNLETASGSFSTRTTNLETASGSFSTRVTNAESSITSLNSRSGSFATTGSNTFIGTQTITGSLFITENLTVLGSSSISYVSQSTLNIGTNLITVNAQNPSIRFGGLAVIDSGSAPQVSGSWLFDSVQDRWIMIHQQSAGAALTSSIGIMGPETYNNLGSETTLTLNRLVKGFSGASGEHIGDSNISDTGTVVSINSATQVTGSLGVTGASTFASSVTADSLNINTSTVFVKASIADTLTATSIGSNYNPGILNIQNKSATNGNLSLIGFQDASQFINLAAMGSINETHAGSPNSVTGALAFYTKTSGTGFISERMRITSGGNVGIGTTSPLQTAANRTVLTINGTTSNVLNFGVGGTLSAYIYSDASDSGFYAQGNLYLQADGAKFTAFVNNGSERMRITSGGNIGIGTTSPGAKLEIVGLTRIITGGFQIGKFGVPSNPLLSIGLDQPGFGTNAIVNGWGNSSNGGIAVGTTRTDGYAFTVHTGVTMDSNWQPSGSGTYAFVVAGGGNVGIGTTSPFSSLDVSISSTGAICVGNSSTGISSGDLIGAISFVSRDASTYSSGGVSNIRSYATETYNSSNVGADLRFYTTNAIQNINADVLFGTERMRITNLGNVGIGTTSVLGSSTERTIHLAAPANNYATLYLTNSTNTLKGIFALGDPASSIFIGSQSNHSFGFVTNDTERMRITSAGRVGIQNTSPQGKFEVGAVDSNSTYGGHFFSTFTIPVDTWSVVFYAPSNDQWNAITEFTWTSAADFNRSGAAYMRWAYEPGAAALGVVYTLFNNSQNSTASFRKSGNEIQVYITGGAANYYVQVRIQGSKAS